MIDEQIRNENTGDAKNNLLLQNRTVRQFIALKIMQEQNEEFWSIVADPKGKGQYVDILLQMFSFE